MRVAFIGDVIGSPGREMLKKYVPICKKKYSIDFVVANCENASGGFGLSAKNAIEIFSYGIDTITGGNHSFDKKDIIPLMDEFAILRPYNLHKSNPGKGVITIKKKDMTLSIINMIGVVGLNISDNMFLCTKKAIDECESPNILIDIHAEMTSEKMAYFWDNKGKVSAIFGTHTHVGTDDLKIKDNTAFVCDVGCTGSREGSIVMDADASIYAFKTGLKKAISINKEHKRIFQTVIFDCQYGKTSKAFKLKIIDEKHYINEAIND